MDFLYMTYDQFPRKKERNPKKRLPLDKNANETITVHKES